MEVKEQMRDWETEECVNVFVTQQWPLQMVPAKIRHLFKISGPINSLPFGFRRLKGKVNKLNFRWSVEQENERNKFHVSFVSLSVSFVIRFVQILLNPQITTSPTSLVAWKRGRISILDRIRDIYSPLWFKWTLFIPNPMLANDIREILSQLTLPSPVLCIRNENLLLFELNASINERNNLLGT